jgi:hypothetical protein
MTLYIPGVVVNLTCRVGYRAYSRSELTCDVCRSTVCQDCWIRELDIAIARRHYVCSGGLWSRDARCGEGV